MPVEAPRHLIHVGFPKAGATFVKAWAAARDDVAFAPGGFAGFRDVFEVPDEEAAASPPRLRLTSCEDFVGRISARKQRAMRGRWRGGAPDWERASSTERQEQAGLQEATCRVLQDLFPTASVLVLVRGYQGLVRSGLAQSLKVGKLAWRHAVEAGGGGLALGYDYDRVVAIYERAFGPDRVTVLPYELLRDDREAFVAALCRAGGVPPRPFDPGRVNASPPPEVLGLLWRLSGPVHGAIHRLPTAWGARAEGGYVRFVARTHSRPAAVWLARALRVPPLPEALLSDTELRAAFGGRAEQVARRPEVAPYAAEYLVDL